MLWTSPLEEGRAPRSPQWDRCAAPPELDLPPARAGANEHDGWSNLVTAVCREHGINAVDVDADFPAVLADHLRQSDVDIRPRTDLYQRQRRIKTAQEVAWITATENAGMASLQKAIDIIAASEIKDGLLYHDGRKLSSKDLIYTVESHLLENGMGTEDSICCGGPEAADPHRAMSDVIRAGLPIVLDIFPYDKRSRYWGDMTRTVVRGTPPPEVQRMWEAVLEAQQAGLDTVKPGANGRDVHIACCEVFKRHGYGSLAKPYRDIASDVRFHPRDRARGGAGDPRVPARQRIGRGPRGRRRRDRRARSVRPALRRHSNRGPGRGHRLGVPQPDHASKKPSGSD